MADDRYEERYCAYIDILGFTKLIGDLSKDPAKFTDIQQVLLKIHDPHRVEVSQGANDKVDFQAQSISDAVCISTKCNALGLQTLISVVQNLVRSLLKEGYFTRGAICRGKLYHDNKTVFGEALIDAYTLESQIVRYPRIMLTKNVVGDIYRENKSNLPAYVAQGDDGPYYLHILRSLAEHLHRANDRSQPGREEAALASLGYYEDIRQKVMERLFSSVDNPRHFEKARWFSNYWNETVDPIGGQYVMRIDGPGVQSFFLPPVDNSIP